MSAEDEHWARRACDAEAQVEALRAAADASPYVDCICPGCPRKVPQAWASGMCEPCCAEDCEHTDGARAVAVERDLLREQLDGAEAEVEARRASEALLAASLKRADAEVERLREDLNAVKDRENLALAGYAKYRQEMEEETQRLRATLLAAFRVRDEAKLERDRLRAVLGETPENVEAVRREADNQLVLSAKRRAANTLAALRARAGQP